MPKADTSSNREYCVWAKRALSIEMDIYQESILVKRNRALYIKTLALAISIISTSVLADNWPTYRHDNRRSGITSESISLPLEEAWCYSSPVRPKSAWSAPARWDAFAKIKNLASMRDFDNAFYTISASGNIYFASTIDDAVHCLDNITGKEKWHFTTDAPVRIAPSWHDDKLYFGSDDGYAYCINALSGELIWKYMASDDKTIIPGNGRMISVAPCRTGVLYQDGKVYFGSSLLPWRESYLCCLNAKTGQIKSPGEYKIKVSSQTMQGALLASDDKLYISQGRQSPVAFDLRTGKSHGAIGSKGFGGIYAILTENSTLIHGRGQKRRAGGELRLFDGGKLDHIVTFPNATCMVVTKDIAYFSHSAREMAAFNRKDYLDLQAKVNVHSRKEGSLNKQLKKAKKKKDTQRMDEIKSELGIIAKAKAKLEISKEACYLWRQESDYYHSLILAGETLFAGGKGSIAAIDTKNGKIIWQYPVDGIVHGLAVADGRLFVSCDTGKIYCLKSSD